MKHSIIFVILALNPGAFASSQPIYSFQANNSSRTSEGKCIQSVLQVTQFDDVLIVANSSNSTDIFKLNREQIIGFSRLANRKHGQSVEVAIQNGQETLTFKGESCGRFLCDSLVISDGSGPSITLEQPIHGLQEVTCD